MTVPYLPTPLATPIVNPAIGSTGAPPIPYLSNSQYAFAPTAMNAKDLNPGGDAPDQQQSLADVIRRASQWADSICFGADPSDKGASLAASLSVEGATVRIKGGELRLICDYRPIVEVVGISVGSGLASLSPIDASRAALARFGRKTIYIPFGGPTTVNRTGDGAGTVPGGIGASAVYAVWSYVNGYPHTALAADVAADATTCVVDSTDGNGGLWAVYPASGAFPGAELTVIAGPSTERVFVQSIETNTPSPGKTTLTTSPFAYAHTVPPAPDFIPVTAIPEDVTQAVISLVTMLIKTRGVRGLIMPTTPGGRVTQSSKTKLGHAGALEDFEIACKLLHPYGVRTKKPGSY